MSTPDDAAGVAAGGAVTAVVAGKNARERARASALRGEAAACRDDDDFIIVREFVRA
jgi:hypothetical protein